MSMQTDWEAFAKLQGLNPNMRAMKLALEALEWNLAVIEDFGDKEQLNRQHNAITALRQALKTEPFEYWNAVEGWVKIDEVREHFDSVGCGTIYKSAGEGRSPLYTAPTKKQWVGLTDQEIEDLWNQHERRFDFYSFSCDIEAKLKEKNT